MNIDFNFNIEMYGCGLPHVSVTTGQLVDCLLDCSIKNKDLAFEIKELLGVLVNPERYNEDGQIDTLLLVAEKDNIGETDDETALEDKEYIVFCYQDNDFFEVERYVCKEILDAIKILYSNSTSKDSIRLFQLKEKRIMKEACRVFDCILHGNSEVDFVEALNSLDLNVDKDINIE